MNGQQQNPNAKNREADLAAAQAAQALQQAQAAEAQMNQQVQAWNAQWHEEETPGVDERPVDFVRPAAAKSCACLLYTSDAADE